MSSSYDIKYNYIQIYINIKIKIYEIVSYNLLKTFVCLHHERPYFLYQFFRFIVLIKGTQMNE